MMNIIKWILPISVLILAISCTNKQRVKTQEELIDEEIVQSENEELDNSALFHLTAGAIIADNTILYNSLVSNIVDIDALFGYKPLEDAYEYIHNFSLLGIACKYNKLEIVKDLVQRGAQIDIASEDEIFAQDAIYHAVNVDNLEMIDFY